jgi:hypothetical protein
VLQPEAAARIHSSVVIKLKIVSSAEENDEIIRRKRNRWIMGSELIRTSVEYYCCCYVDVVSEE